MEFPIRIYNGTVNKNGSLSLFGSEKYGYICDKMRYFIRLMNDTKHVYSHNAKIKRDADDV